MAIMKSPRDQMEMMALKEASLSMDDQQMDMGEEMLCCPKCKYEGMPEEFDKSAAAYKVPPKIRG